MDDKLQQEITQILTEFAGTKASAQVLEVQGPAQEGTSFRWRMISNRNKEVTVIVSTKKPMFGKSAMTGIEVYGLAETKTLKPDLKELQEYLMQSELVQVR